MGVSSNLGLGKVEDVGHFTIVDEVHNLLCCDWILHER
jgi:hypothetical protein